MVMESELLRRILSEDLLDAAVDLQEIGTNQLAWPREAAVRVVAHLAEHGLAILGGDVLVIEGGRPAYTYDNWYVPKKKPADPWEEYVAGARETATSYITKYNERERRIVYSLVFVSSQGYDEL